jgi:hypothetical protein
MAQQAKFGIVLGATMFDVGDKKQAVPATGNPEGFGYGKSSYACVSSSEDFRQIRADWWLVKGNIFVEPHDRVSSVPSDVVSDGVRMPAPTTWYE